MSEKEYQSKCVKLFQRNTVLINELETANNRIAELEAENAELKEKYNVSQELVAYYKSILKGE